MKKTKKIKLYGYLERGEINPHRWSVLLSEKKEYEWRDRVRCEALDIDRNITTREEADTLT